MRLSARNGWLLAFSALIPIGLFPFVDIVGLLNSDGSGAMFIWPPRNALSATFLFFVLLASFGSTFPLLLIGWRVVGDSTLPPVLTAALGIIALIVGVLMSFVGWLFGNAAATLALISGLSTSFAVAAAIYALSGTRLNRLGNLIVFAGLTPAALAAIWSLSCVGAIWINAVQISGGEPYCLAHQKGRRPIKSLWELRGFSFIDSTSSYDRGVFPFFHGVMLVGEGDSVRYYNWSPRRLRLDHIERPENLFWEYDLYRACTPRPNFLETL